MRWRIPIVAALAVFVAASCDQAPVEPAAETALDAPSFKAEVTHGSFFFTDEFPVLIDCGGVAEWADASLAGKVRHYGETIDAAGGFHFRGTMVIKGTAVGEFGSEWTIHTAWPTTGYWPPGEDDFRVYNDHVTDMWVGKGHAPSWNDWANYKWTRNANGEVKVDRYTTKTTCP